MDSKFCPQCGHELAIDAKRCPYCGHVFQDAVSQPSAPQQPSAKPESTTESQAPRQMPSNPQPPKKQSKMFIYLLVGLIVLILIAGGFLLYRSNHNDTAAPAAHSSTAQSQRTQSPASSSSASSSSTYHDNINWDSDKATSFDEQFSKWADRMHQSYTSGDTSFDGVDYPEDFNHKKFIINGDDATISMAGSNRNTEYKVVEIRYDSDQGYLYLFAFHDGTPIVLFTQSGDAGDSEVSFKTTANGELRNLFSNFSAN